jgi:hypothetical protein
MVRDLTGHKITDRKRGATRHVIFLGDGLKLFQCLFHSFLGYAAHNVSSVVAM